ncbi:MAG: zinc metallopeptidase [Clostridia bacterium]|nr:zinc metallopeptidase [Clostridia bacterium]
MYFYEYIRYLIFAAPVLIFAMIAQAGVRSAYSKYSKVRNSRMLTGAMAAQMVLDHYGVKDVDVRPCAGTLTDNFNPRDKTIYLSEGVYGSTTISAVGIACHEAGHAAQHAVGYVPNKIRSALVPITNFGSRFGLLIAFIGYFIAFFSNSPISVYVVIFGLALYGLVALFQLVTLPVEFNASRRALKVIDEVGLLSAEEYKGAKKVLTAAAMTYVAALATAFVNLIYYAVRLLGGNRRR